MGRGKRLIALAVHVSFVLLCFVLTYLFQALSVYDGGKIKLADEELVDKIFVSAKHDASMDYDVVDGRLVMDVYQDSGSYDDLRVAIDLGALTYDTSYYERLLGAEAENYTEFLSAMESGPWLGNYIYLLTGDSLVTDRDLSYTLSFGNGEPLVESIASSAANEKNTSKDISLNAQQPATLELIMGSEQDGPLPAGRYYLSLDLALRPQADGEAMAFPLGLQMKMMATVAAEALQGVSFADFFQISSLMTFYGMMCVFGLVFYLWVDLRSALKIAGHALTAGGVTHVIVRTYVNGVFQGEHEEYRSGGSLFVAILAFLFSMMLFVLTIPLRMVILILKDLFHVLAGDDNADSYPLLGNILGSIGIYGAYVALVGWIAGWHPALIAVGGIVGLLLMILAGKLCRACEED